MLRMALALLQPVGALHLDALEPLRPVESCLRRGAELAGAVGRRRALLQPVGAFHLDALQPLRPVETCLRRGAELARTIGLVAAGFFVVADGFVVDALVVLLLLEPQPAAPMATTANATHSTRPTPLDLIQTSFRRLGGLATRRAVPVTALSGIAVPLDGGHATPEGEACPRRVPVIRSLRLIKCCFVPDSSRRRVYELAAGEVPTAKLRRRRRRACRLSRLW